MTRVCVLCSRTLRYSKIDAVALGYMGAFYVHRDRGMASVCLRRDGDDRYAHESCVAQVTDAVLADKSRIAMGRP